MPLDYKATYIPFVDLFRDWCGATQPNEVEFS